MKGYKGFYPGMVCIPNCDEKHKKEYNENTVYEEDKAVCCSSGMHFCKYPLDVFAYYPPSSSKGLSEYAEVEALDEPVTDDNEKFCSKKLKIGAKIGIPALVQASVEYIKENIEKTKIKTNTGDRSAATNTGNCSAATNTGDCSAATNTGDCSAATNTGNCSAATNTGNCSAATNTGDCSAATNTGDCSAATNTGYYSAASVEGKDSIALAFGIQSKAKGALGCYIVLAEWAENDSGDYELKAVKCHKVDGKIIKPDTWYMLKNGKFMEVE